MARPSFGTHSGGRKRREERGEERGGDRGGQSVEGRGDRREDRDEETGERGIAALKRSCRRSTETCTNGWSHASPQRTPAQ